MDHVFQRLDIIQEGFDKELHLVLRLNNRYPLLAHEELI
jgi:hypothetical protein